MVPYMGMVSASRNGGGATWRRQALGSLLRWPAPIARIGTTLPIRIRRTTRGVSNSGSSARPVGTTPSIARPARPGHRADAMRARPLQGRSSTGRATVSKTVGCGFESCRPCHLNRRTGTGTAVQRFPEAADDRRKLHPRALQPVRGRATICTLVALPGFICVGAFSTRGWS